VTLQPHEKVSLALRLIAASCFDPACDLNDDPRQVSARRGACSLLQSQSDNTLNAIQTNEDIPLFFSGCSEGLNSHVAVRPDIMIGQAVLRKMGAGLLEGSGDGQVCGPNAIRALCSGLLELAFLIETNIRDVIGRTTGLGPAALPAITYDTSLTEFVDEFLPFHVSGASSITVSPRIVDLIVEDRHLDATDVVDLAYVIHHELICHAFQTSVRYVRPRNASESCYWSEGWMDTLAFERTKEWLNAKADFWRPMSVNDAIARATAYHQHRYGPGSKLGVSHTTRRRMAREAVSRLVSTFDDFGIIPSRADAERRVEDFSWCLNLRWEPENKALRDAVLAMIKILITPMRARDHVAIAEVCLNFVNDQNVNRFCREMPAL